MDYNAIYFNNVNLDDDRFDDNESETIIHVGQMAWSNGYKQCDTYEKVISKELMPVAWHPIRWWDWCMPED